MTTTPYLFVEHIPDAARGVAQRAMGLDAPPFPDSRTVCRLVVGSDEWTPFRRSVAGFIRDWDALDLREGDLPAAFGIGDRFAARWVRAASGRQLKVVER